MIEADKNRLELKIKILNSEAILPSYNHEGDAGFDLRSLEDVELKPQERRTLALGIAAEIPVGWYVSFRERSGLADKYGLEVLGGVIDSNYRGEWKLVLFNGGKESFLIKKGERIAQGILELAPQAIIKRVENLSPTERAEGGLGSTGR